MIRYQLILLVVLVLFANISYAKESVGEDLAALIQSYAIAQACDLDHSTREKAARYILKYIDDNIPAEHAQHVAELSKAYIKDQTAAFQDIMTITGCKEFAEVWYEAF